MIMEVGRASLRGETRAIPSKSDAHRAIACAMLADSPTTIVIDALSEDVAATLDCARALGCGAEATEGAVIVTPGKVPESVCALDCRESGSTLRFFLSIAGALGADAEFTGRGRLPQRPITTLLECLEEHGITASSRRLPLRTSGRLTGGEFRLPGNISSQYLTGLLLALPATGEAGRITLTTPLESAGYVDMTLRVMRRFGVEVEYSAEGFGSYAVKAGSKYVSPGVYEVEGDWSGTAALMCMAALHGDLEIAGLDTGSAQPDCAIADALLSMGAELIYRAGGSIVVRSNGLCGAEIDVSQCPDIAPVLAAAATVAQGTTRIVNAARLRMKESDRLNDTAACLSEIGASIVAGPDSLTITGKPELAGGYADAHGDHRLTMALAVAAQGCAKPLRIIGAQSVMKSYPGFFEQLTALGMKCTCVSP